MWVCLLVLFYSTTEFIVFKTVFQMCFVLRRTYTPFLCTAALLELLPSNVQNSHAESQTCSSRNNLHHLHWQEVAFRKNKTTYPSICAQSIADNYKVYAKTACLLVTSYSELHIQNSFDQILRITNMGVYWRCGTIENSEYFLYWEGKIRQLDQTTLAQLKSGIIFVTQLISYHMVPFKGL